MDPIEISKNNIEMPLVSVLFITYKRFDMLQMSLEAFRRNTDYPQIEVVIADDGSGPEIQAQIRMLKADVYALAPKSRGLGANNNNGIRHCRGKYVLMIQDDCECCGPPDYLKNTIAVMEANPTVGIINYYGLPNRIDRDRPLVGSNECCYVSSMAYQAGQNSNVYYSDMPHVVSRAATEQVGHYIEHWRMEQCEMEYGKRWQDQTKYISAVFPAYFNQTYIHRGEEKSFRTRSFQNRLERKLLPVAQHLKQHYKPLYHLGRACVRKTIRMLNYLHLVR